jgi:FkbM family methyltransferase
MPSLLQRFASTPLGAIFADQTPVSIYDASLQWLDLPSKEFLDYARSRPRSPHDGVSEDPAVFRQPTTFLLAQSHRIWLTLKLLEPYIEDCRSFTLLDVGSYPFAIAESVRFHLKRQCRIVATVAQRLTKESLDCLRKADIETIPVNLDPRVRMEEPLPGMTDYIPLADQSVDLVVFAHVIEHLYHPIQILREMVRVLKPGGKLLLTTDHGMLLGGLLNYINDGSYLHEPVEGTAAMVFHEWRGHVRYYTQGDLTTLLEAAGAKVIECQLREVLYNSLPEEYFVQPFTTMPKWRADLLAEFPALRNEILMLAEKTVGGSAWPSNPLDVRINAPEMDDLARDFTVGRCILSRATKLDCVFGYRLFFGRWPTGDELRKFSANPPRRGVDELVQSLMASPEFSARSLAVQLERPGPSCVIMTETDEGHRFFFSAQDTFVGFPVAVGVFEPDVRAALDRLVKPGMNCIDIGANIGYHSVRMAAVVKQGEGKVFCFEPEPFNFSLLTRNRTENRMEDVLELYQIACGDENCEVAIYRDANPCNFGGARTRKAGQNGPESERIAIVPMRRLDDLIPEKVPVHLVKIDVEGYEPFVLRGMSRLIHRCRPRIVMEFNVPALQQFGQTTPQELLRWLSNHSYIAIRAGVFARGEFVEFVWDEEVVFENLVCLPLEYFQSLRQLSDSDT